MEDFWGAALTKSNKELKWEVEDDEGDSMYSEKCLELRQACLGAGAKVGERNVVELITDDDDGEEVTHALVSMKVGGTEMAPLFLTLQPPVSFKLVQGSGPVHIVGQITETIDLSMMDDEDDDDEEEEEEEEVKDNASDDLKIKKATSLKRPAPTSASALPKKMAKVEPDSALDMSNGDDDKEEDEEEDDEEDEDEDDEVDDEEDDEDMEEESEEEEQVKPTPRKLQNNSASKKNGTPHIKAKQGSLKTPQPPKTAASKQSKTSRSLPNTPKALGDKKAAQGKEIDIDEIKQKLLKAQVPKKLAKFNNFISNSFKIKEDSLKKQLWEFVQKNQQ